MSPLPADLIFEDCSQSSCVRTARAISRSSPFDFRLAGAEAINIYLESSIFKPDALQAVCAIGRVTPQQAARNHRRQRRAYRPSSVLTRKATSGRFTLLRSNLPPVSRVDHPVAVCPPPDTFACECRA